MELWIRSQDKNLLIPINDIISVFQESVFYKGIILGQYKSKERALEIIDHIQYLIEQTGELTDDIVKHLRVKFDDNEWWSINSTSNTATYKMPEE